MWSGYRAPNTLALISILRSRSGARYVSLFSLLFVTTLSISGETPQSENSTPLCAAAEFKQGLIVETIAKGSEGEKAGLTHGDIILNWARSDVKGEEIESPFDLSEIEIEQGPRGRVTLEGTRVGLKQKWVMGPDKWGIRARPSLPPPLLAILQEAQELAKADKLSEAAERSRAAAAEAKKYQCSWLGPWFLSRAAQALANAQHWNDSKALYQEAIEEASGAGPEVKAQLLQALARIFDQLNDPASTDKYRQEALKEILKLGVDTLAASAILTELGDFAGDHGDVDKEETYYRRSLEIRQKLAPDSLAVASTLNGLGYAAEDRGDLNTAEGCQSQALEIRGKLAPGSIAVAKSLNALGNLAKDRGDLEKAKSYYLRSLEIQERLTPDSLGVAAGLNNLGNVEVGLGILDKAEEYVRGALAIREKLAPGGLDVASSLLSLGLIAGRRGDEDGAEDFYRQALKIKAKIAPGSLAVAMLLGNLGSVEGNRGNLAQAEDYTRQALAIQEKIASDSLDVASSLNTLGVIAEQRRDLIGAEKSERRALAICEKVAPGSPEMGATLNGLGIIAQDRGDLNEATGFYQQSYAIYQKLAPETVAVVPGLTNLGNVAQMRGDLAGAVEFLQHALAIDEKAEPGSLRVSTLLNNRGEVELAGGSLDKAEESFQKALTIIEKLAPRSLAAGAMLTNLAAVALGRGDIADTEMYDRRALEIRKELAPESAEYADSLALLAAIMRDRQQPEQALQLYREAIDVLESQMARLGGSSNSQSEFRARRAEYYTAYTDLLAAQKQKEFAFEVLERSRARALLETLAEAHVNIRQGADPAQLERERTLQQAMSAKSIRRIDVLQRKHTPEQVAALSKEIEELLNQYQEVEAQIRTSSPAYAGLTQPRPLTAKQIQQQLLDDHTLLLEYSLGEKRSLVFVLTATSLEAYELPKRADIETTARQVYDLLITLNRPLKGETTAQRIARVKQGQSEYRKAVSILSEMVLGPVAGQLAHKRLLVVADGALQYIPFAILPVSSPGSSQPAAPLVIDHVIVNLPSASVLALLRQQPKKPAWTKEVAVLADPVFDKDDSRVVNVAKIKQVNAPDTDQKAVPPLSAHLSRSLGDVGLDEVVIRRLASTRQEADAIVAMAHPGKGMEALDFQASRETALSKDLGQYRIVHFATHGLLDNQHPELSGLVLSLVDRHGETQDGFLDLEDVYNLRLPTDLVVLSACETGLGKQINGEGLIGLTRGFMYAGASRVVASLWSVDDVATAELMERFYRGMLKENLPPADALRRAQIEMQRQKPWSDPYYWAAFTIQGEWQ